MQIEGDGRVTRFQPRTAAPREAAPRRSPKTGHAPPEKTEKHEPETEEDHRHRLWLNFLSSVVIVTLMTTGVWVVNGLVTATRGSQDCFRPGASDCGAILSPLPPPSLMRWSPEALRS